VNLTSLNSWESSINVLFIMFHILHLEFQLITNTGMMVGTTYERIMDWTVQDKPLNIISFFFLNRNIYGLLIVSFDYISLQKIWFAI